MITTEVYVSLDGLNYNILDIAKNESIEMKFSKKDLQDITKVFSPYSMNFNFPTTPRNKLALGFFGNTDVLKTNTTNEFDCKIYTNGMLSQIGKLKLRTYKKNEFTASFTTTFLSLKDRLGDALISDLSENPTLISWKANNVFNRLENPANVTINGVAVNYFVPLISNRRVWQYSDDLAQIDNVRFNPANSPTSDKVINTSELRPVVSVVSLLNLIKSKYGLAINTPLEATPDLQQLFLWANGSNFSAQTDQKFIIARQFNNESPSIHGTAVSNLTDSSVLITKNTDTFAVEYQVALVDTVVGEPTDSGNATISIVRKSDLVTVLSFNFDVKNGLNNYVCAIPNYLFVANQFEFFTFVKFDRPVHWRVNSTRVLFRRAMPFFNKSSTYENNFNSDATGSSNIDIIKALPEMKVIDFLTSYLKTFNLSIYDSSPSDDNLYFLTQKDIDTTSLVYSKREVDYSAYGSEIDVEKSVNNPYNYYTFKHADSKYKSNSDFEKQFGIKYGQTFFPLIKPEKANEFKVETKFSIIPPVQLLGLEIVTTAYGFTNGNPDIDDVGRFRYSPNLDEPTLFYSHGRENFSSGVGFADIKLNCQNIGTNGLLTVSSLNAYIKVLPFCKENLNTLSFSILTFNGVNYTNSLFQNYYSKFIQRLLNPNALSQTFNLILPASEIYLNEDSTVQGLGKTPNGFRLQNEIIIGETRFEILEAVIDITTGKAKLTLLNF